MDKRRTFSSDVVKRMFNGEEEFNNFCVQYLAARKTRSIRDKKETFNRVLTPEDIEALKEALFSEKSFRDISRGKGFSVRKYRTMIDRIMLAYLYQNKDTVGL